MDRMSGLRLVVGSGVVAGAVIFACGGSVGASGSPAGPSDGVGDTAGSTRAASSFSTIAPSYFDPSTLSPEAFSYQMADYDAPRNRVLFYPYGEIAPSYATTGLLLSYNAGGAFTDPTSWITVDLTKVVSQNAVNFGGGFLDPAGGYAYLSPAAYTANAVAVQIDLAAQYAHQEDPSAYAAFAPSAQNIPNCNTNGHHLGGFGGVFADGFAYFVPGDGIALRYDGTKPFADGSSWQCFDLTTINDPNASMLTGMQSNAYVAPYVYYIPFSHGLSTNNPTLASVLVRYDTTKDFTSASSCEVFDLASLAKPLGAPLGTPTDAGNQFNGFTGGVVVGTRLVLVPWGLRNIKVTNSVALLFDTTRPLTDPGAWQYMDLRTVDPSAGGYQFGWLDRDGLVWLVPTHNYNLPPPGNPPFIAWNSNLPFTWIGAWKSYPNDKPNRPVWSTGAAYDPATNTAWFAPYGAPPGGTMSALITQFTAYDEPTPTATGTATATRTATTPTPTRTVIPTRTGTPTATSTLTVAPTASVTRTRTASQTAPTSTQAPTPALTPSAAATVAASATVTPVRVRGDVNCDGRVTAADLIALLQLLPTGNAGPCGGGDVNQDGAVTIDDLFATVAAIFE